MHLLRTIVCSLLLIMLRTVVRSVAGASQTQAIRRSGHMIGQGNSVVWCVGRIQVLFGVFACKLCLVCVSLACFPRCMLRQRPRKVIFSASRMLALDRMRTHTCCVDSCINMCGVGVLLCALLCSLRIGWRTKGEVWP
jgi:hypothetical protein